MTLNGAFCRDLTGSFPPKAAVAIVSDLSARLWHCVAAHPRRRAAMAKGRQRSNKEARKPKKAKVKTNASNPSQKSGPRGLENLKNG
jgi:hypothetical protein